MLIDLKNGHIDAHNFKLTAGDRILISAGDSEVAPEFRIMGANGGIYFDEKGNL
jgi:hypothetical protein